MPINVTPLVDVIVVLLVVFLIVGPTEIGKLDVQVPRKIDDIRCGDDRPLPELVVRVRADLSVVLIDEDTEVSLAAGELPAGLRAHLRETTHVVFVEFDDAVLWDHVVSTIDTIRGVATATEVAVMVRD